jgi:hypothetical protein
MNGVKANAGPRMENTRLREPSVLKLPHSRPVQVMFLTATNQNLSHSRVTLKRNTQRLPRLPGIAW